MKKLLTLTAVGALLAAPAMAVQKCVNLDAGDYGDREEDLYDRPDWFVSYVDYGGPVVRGIGICSSDYNEPGTFSSRLDKLTFDGDNLENNKYCWCKMIAPAVSYWVSATADFGTLGTTAAGCLHGCAELCQQNLTDFGINALETFDNLIE